MRTADAPVQACPAHRPPLAGQRSKVDSGGSEESLAGRFDPQFLVVGRQDAPRQESLQHRHGALASQMVVADAGLAHGGVTRAGAGALRPGGLGHAHDRFQHSGDGLPGEPEIAVAALARRQDQAALRQLGKMRTGGGQGNAGLERKLAGGQGAAADERRQHVGAGGITHQTGDAGNIRSFTHSSMLIEAFSCSKA